MFIGNLVSASLSFRSCNLGSSVPFCACLKMMQLKKYIYLEGYCMV
jgi:hypothetical protein